MIDHILVGYNGDFASWKKIEENDKCVIWHMVVVPDKFLNKPSAITHMALKFECFHSLTRARSNLTFESTFGLLYNG